MVPALSIWKILKKLSAKDIRMRTRGKYACSRQKCVWLPANKRKQPISGRPDKQATTGRRSTYPLCQVSHGGTGLRQGSPTLRAGCKNYLILKYMLWSNMPVCWSEPQKITKKLLICSKGLKLSPQPRVARYLKAINNLTLVSCQNP